MAIEGQRRVLMCAMLGVSALLVWQPKANAAGGWAGHDFAWVHGRFKWPEALRNFSSGPYEPLRLNATVLAVELALLALIATRMWFVVRSRP